ncbi:MAG: hypothetical protein J0J10_25960 [Bosea sp.]|uniref:hypothetical protein n=1 Tax=Bosea sp. (in: a-proteobacteria) TaxID=1871050 RepID=UPI001AC73FF2|nr:hypothetical protein [Bosea sp. (in: a-proteobacteria)]MBN9472211.1 hypothetical protein [Bosea sp. (in: a-proteobacteria)]
MPEELSREFEPTAQFIANWVRQLDRDSGKRSYGATTAEREELDRLRRVNQRLRYELDNLSKAAAWFARNGLPLQDQHIDLAQLRDDHFGLVALLRYPSPSVCQETGFRAG